MEKVLEIIGHISEIISPPYPEIGNLIVYLVLIITIWGTLTKLRNWHKAHKALKNERISSSKTDSNRRNR